LSEKEKTVFDLLVKPLRKLVEQKEFLKPTEPQAETIPKILDGKNVLLISPTATGKTEAAVLPVFNMLIQMPDRGHGIKVLYVTPLRALNRDLLERLEFWCNNLDIRLAVRHGDTEQRERTRQTRSPPDVLITTPETLQAILSGWVLRQHLQQVRWVIIDEVHEMADSKRGSQLALALERLRLLTREEFQLIGLSATIGSPQEVAQFLVGNGRPVEIVRVPVARTIKLQILFPQPTPQDYELASQLYTHPEVAARLRIIRDYIERHRSVILFTNTRSISEVLASRFKVWDVDFPVAIHHGSLAKPSRIAAERGLKEGGLKGLVATSSLELGIDIGRIDLVIQYMSPRQVTRLIQRVGRSGHRVGRVANGIIITMDSDDTLEALVIARMAPNEELEPVQIPNKPYDVLAHQIAGMLMKQRRLTFYEVIETFKRAYPYKDLTEEDVAKVFTYMHSRFPRLAWVSFEDQLALKPRRTQPLYEYYFDNLSMIPVEKQYLVIDDSTNSAVGVLDEAFVAEFAKPGVKFVIRGSPWSIVHVYGDKIHVKPVQDPSGAIPSWIGEEIPVPFEVSQEVGRIRGFVEEQAKKGLSQQEIGVLLSEKYPSDGATIARALHETFDHVKKGFLMPTDKRLVLEDWEEFVILHANFGSLANRAVAQLLGHLISERAGHSVVAQHDPYRIFFQTLGTLKADGLISLLDEVKAMSDEAIREQLTRATVKTGMFKRRMIHVARRFGALKRWVDFSNVSLRSLMQSFEGTVIHEEALKETFTKDLDMEKAVEIVEMLRKGAIIVEKIDTGGVASPVARVGLERVSMKTDLIPSEKMRVLLVESAKARLLNEVRTFVCTQSWDYSEMIRIKDLPDKPVCPKCGSPLLGVLRLEEEQVQSLIDKQGMKLTKREEEIKEYAKDTARLLSKYGKPAAIALSARRVKAADADKVLKQEPTPTDHFYELVLDAERKVLKKRFR
jgi:ATP-dependent Lhr-like helicase